MPDKPPIVAGIFSSKKIKNQGHADSGQGKEIACFGGDAFPGGSKKHSHCRYFRIAGIRIRLESDLPIHDSTFAAKFEKFRIPRPHSEVVRIAHHFSLPIIQPDKLGREIYRKAPWAIYRRGSSWIYLGIRPGRKMHSAYSMAIFNEAHTFGQIHHEESSLFSQGNLHSLTLFPTDQIWLARLLAGRQGFIFHAAGMKVGGRGLLFAGHSEAGKSTAVILLQGRGEILCDDRIIVRRWPDGFRIHGTWSHGDVPQVSPAAAPLRAVLFLEKAKSNRLIPIADPREVLKRILPLLIKPLVTADWWEKTLAVVEKLVREVPAYRLQFDQSGKINEIIRELVTNRQNKNKPRRQGRLP